MRTRSLVWAILPSLTLVNAITRTFETKTKCIYLDGLALCPGERRVLQSNMITVAAGFPPNSKSVAQAKPKWYETLWVRPNLPIWPFWEYSEYYLGDDECFYTTKSINSGVLLKCPNLKYAYGDEVPNPWHTKNYGPDGPVDWKEPQHFGDPSKYVENREYLGKEGIESVFDSDGLLPLGGAPPKEQAPGRRKPFEDEITPQNPPPRLKDLIRPVTPYPFTPPHSEADDPEQEAFAGGVDGTDYSLFTTGAIADSGTTSTNGIFDGAANGASDVTATLDPSIFENAGNLFDATNQADLTAFDPSSFSSNIASSNNEAWTSALLPSDNSNLFTADNGGFTNGDLFAAGNGETGITADLFTADNGGNSYTDNLFSGDDDISLLSPPAGAADDNLFAKRYQKISPRDFRF